MSEDYAPESIYAPVPGHWIAELPNQSLQSIAYGLGVFWDYTGDISSVRKVLPAIVSYLLSWRMNGDLVVPRSCPGKPHAADVQCPGIWDWCDG